MRFQNRVKCARYRVKCARYRVKRDLPSGDVVPESGEASAVG